MFDARPNLASAGSGAPFSNYTPQQHGQPGDASGRQDGGSVTDKFRNLLSMERLQEFREQKLSKVRPWAGEFLNRGQFSLPEGVVTAQNRLTVNLGYFQSNYVIIILLLFVYCVVTHLFLALVIAGMFCGFLYINSLPPDFNTQVGGMLITKKTLTVFLIIVGLSMFLFTGIGSTFFWLVGIWGLIVGAHAAMHEPSLESDFASQQA